MKFVAQADFAQKLFDYHAFAAGVPSRDKNVSAAVMSAINDLLPAATNKPIGSDVDPAKVDHKADAKSALADVTKLFNGQQQGSVSLVILGEDHTNAQDAQRANKFIAAINDGSLAPSIVVFERGMTYNAPTSGLPIIREDNLTSTGGVQYGLNLSRAQRSMVVAGYLVLLAGGGDQHDINKILIFYGENHFDILTHFNYFARHTNASYLLKEPRTIFSVRSYG